ncbi:MAG: Glyoxalase [Mycobacterium sp.]|jgi:hypothetical protein|nr:Glyoxalase [Mycobacterium sp.]
MPSARPAGELAVATTAKIFRVQPDVYGRVLVLAEPARRPYGVTAECADDQGGRFYLDELRASGLAIRTGAPSSQATTASMVSE